MRDLFFLAVGVAATPAWLTYGLGAGAVLASTAVGWAWLSDRERPGCACGCAQDGAR